MTIVGDVLKRRYRLQFILTTEEFILGDRANIVVLDSDKPIYLYTHWNGDTLPEILREALIKGKNRWGDPTYLTRIIFCNMVKDNIDGETGFGISPELCDNEHELLVVNIQDGCVYTYPEMVHDKHKFSGLSLFPNMSFEKYIEEPRTWKSFTKVRKRKKDVAQISI